MTDKTFLADLFIMLEQNRVDEMRTLLREKLGTWEFHELNPDRVVVVRAPREPPKSSLERAADEAARKRFPIEDWQYEVANEDTRLGYEEWLDHQLEAEESDQEVNRPQPVVRCAECGNEIDPEMCYCGTSYADHNAMEQGHNFVPAGCDCGRVKEADGILPIIRVASDAYEDDLVPAGAYGDGLVLDYYKNPDGNFGDTLAKFIATEIREVVSADQAPSARLDTAHEAVRKAAQQLSIVADALWRAHLVAEQEEKGATTCPGQEPPPKS